MMDAPRFDFGKNWQSFSKFALTTEGVERARADFRNLFRDVDLSGRTFLDIGFGQGLGLCFAAEGGAKACGNDIDPNCVGALETTLTFFPQLDQRSIRIVSGSVLDRKVLEELQDFSGPTGFDIVHSWGVLHHTGQMNKALEHASSLVKAGGYLVIAIYNRHFTSPLWRLTKRSFVAAPPLLQRAMIALFCPVIAIAKAAITGRNPFKKDRGMDFYHDVVDWVGGYPYEYASADEISAKLLRSGLSLERFIPAETPTGCNQFVFRRGGRPERSERQG